jgi:hypothetical protein
MSPMIDRVEELLQRGSAVLAPLLLKHGFLFKAFALGGSSGGSYASGEFTRSTRRLEFHVRHSLGIVSYLLADRSMSHQQYMRSVHGVPDRNYYPGSQAIRSTPFSIYFAIWKSKVAISLTGQMNACFVAFSMRWLCRRESPDRPTDCRAGQSA